MNVPATIAVGLATTLLSGCFSRTYIYSQPTGAAVVMDHKKSLGTTPVQLDEQVWLWTKHAITVESEGYQSQTINIRSEGLNFGYLAACACTLGLLFPIAMVSKYRKQYIVQLQPAKPVSTAQVVEENASVSFR